MVEKGLEHIICGFAFQAYLKESIVNSQLVFIYDKSIERGAHLSKLIDEAVPKKNR